MTASGGPAADASGLLAEAMTLMDGLQFDSTRGGVAKSDRLFVSIVPDWQDDNRQSFRASLTCTATWHRNVDWQLLRVSIRPQTTSGFFVQHLLPLTGNGAALFEDLAPGEYRLRCYGRLVRFKAPAAEDSDRVELGVAMDESDADRPTADAFLQRDSFDGAVTVLIGSDGGMVTIEFASHEDALAGKTLEYCVANADSGEVYADAATTTFGPAGADDDFKVRTPPARLSFSASDNVEVSYRIL